MIVDAPIPQAHSQTLLVVVPSLRRGGAERTVSRLTQEWAKDHSVILAVFNASGQAYPHGGTLVNLDVPATGGGLLRGIYKGLRRVFLLRRLLRATRPDHVYAFMESANIPVILAALTAGYRRRVTLSVRGNPDQMRGFHKVLAFGLYGWAARIVAVSKGAAQRLSEVAPACAPKVTVIYSPLPLNEITGENFKPSNRKQEVSGIPEGTWFFAAGRLVPGKTFDRMIRIFARADFSGMGSVQGTPGLLIAGDGPEREALESLIVQHGLTGRVRLLGAVDNPFDYMKKAAAFLMTSEHEGFPVVLIEALACGCPILSFDCDFGPREVTRDGDAGFIVPVDNEDLFAQRLSQMASDPVLRKSLSLAAVMRAQDFESTKVAAQWILPSS